MASRHSAADARRASSVWTPSTSTVVLSEGVGLDEALQPKPRRAAEESRAFVPVQSSFHSGERRARSQTRMSTPLGRKTAQRPFWRTARSRVSTGKCHAGCHARRAASR